MIRHGALRMQDHKKLILCAFQVLRQASEKVFVPLTVGGGIKEFTDADGKYYSALDVAAEYFRSGADKVSIGSDAVSAAEEFLRTGCKSGKSSIEQISWVRSCRREQNLQNCILLQTKLYPAHPCHAGIVALKRNLSILCHITCSLQLTAS